MSRFMNIFVGAIAVFLLAGDAFSFRSEECSANAKTDCTEGDLCGSVYVYNDNCTTTCFLCEDHPWVKVTVKSPGTTEPICNTTNIQLSTGEGETVNLKGPYEDAVSAKVCRYTHGADGTVFEPEDIWGDMDGWKVTCKKDWAGVCQCNTTTSPSGC